jgi:zinc transport system ATP-binding protein
MERAIEVKGVYFGYDSRPLLSDISFEVNKGDFMGIVGPNGSAKTTLLKLLLGILEPKQGSIYIFGESVRTFDQWQRLGYISQKARDINSSFPATVEEIIAANIYSEKRSFGISGRRQRDKLEEALSVVDMADYKRSLIGNLSGGQQQRVFIARALVNKPEMIIMDEPLVGVDVSSQDKFYSLMEVLNKKLGITLVMVSHDIGAISDRTNKVACLGNQSIYVHDSSCFNQADYIKQVYGEGINILHHRH